MVRLLGRRRRLAGHLACWAACAALLSACGGGDDPTGTGEAPVDPGGDGSGLGAGPGPGATVCDARANDSVRRLTECVTLAGVRAHQRALQDIADANGGTRVAGSAGYERSVDYAAGVFRAAGYRVTLQPFQVRTFAATTPSLLERITPAPTAAIPDDLLIYSGSGDVTAPVTALPGPGSDATPGCEAADFAGFTPGHIALISRGGCFFADKANLAHAAGAAAVVFYNDGPGPLGGTLGNAFTLDLPVTGISRADGLALAATPGLVMRLRASVARGVALSWNVLAETPGGDADNVVMVGGHLDSVHAGAGINDNGSGSAAILETARQMARVVPRHKVRFALWGAEEAGLVGSSTYVRDLTPAEQDRIAVYLNFDMIGSPNPVFFIYDGDGSGGGGAGPPGSAQIEQVFQRFYTLRGVPYMATPFGGRSDHSPFIDAGIASGGLFTGAEGVKTAEQAALWGGTAGAWYDPCYHQGCDDVGNFDADALDVNADAVAYATLQFALDAQAVPALRAARAAAAP